MKLITNGKEKCLVDSMKGYDGWTVIADNVSKPAEHCFWCEETNGWKEDAAAKARASMLATIRNPEKLADLLVDILARLPKAE